MRFIVPGVPCAKARPRMTKKGHVYTPKETLDFQNRVRVCFHAAYPGHRPIEGPVAVAVIARFLPPKSAKATLKRVVAEKGMYPHTKKPDLDNIVKAVLDALNGVAWRDDSQVWSYAPSGIGYSRKVYADRNEVEVEIKEV